MRAARHSRPVGGLAPGQGVKRVLTHYKLVACPSCGAAAGEPCLTGVGKVKLSGHDPRKRMAAREVARRAESL